mgnify:CR=1 FL=1|tara:strand:- start:427 stop:1167 length:741 start_codon:yes stop_codon:yes gene_type:complete
MIKDKVAIITGASSGIGYATAIALSTAGAKVAIGARRTDKLEQLENQIKNNGGKVLSQRLDVTKKTDCDTFVEQTIKKWGAVDILVNNAGLMPLSFVKNLKVDEWERMIDVNIKGVLFCTAAVIPHMKEKKSGHIVNISSVAGRTVFPSGSVYCATKHAVTAFSEGLRQELSVRSNIRVTCIEPGVVETELLNTITDESLQSFIEIAKKTQGLKAGDIADAILFAVQSPEHMNVNEILVRPTTQER